MKLSLAEILRYSPYDHNYNLESAEFNEHTFKNFFFYKTYVVENEINEFENALSQGKSERKPYILLSGYSGCGKTTLLYYLKNELNKKHGHHIHILNPTLKVQIGDSGIDRLKSTIEREVINGLTNNHELLLMVHKNIFVIRKIRAAENINNGNINDQLEKLVSNALLWQQGDKNNFIFDLHDFVEQSSLTELIFFYILDKIILFKKALSEKYNNDGFENIMTENLVICFDNMDELSFSGFTVDFWLSYRRAEAAIQMILNESNFFLKGDTHKFMTIVLTLRESNVALYSSQWDDRWDPKFLKRRLILDGDVTEIMTLRAEFISKNEPLFENDASSKIKALIEIFNTDKEWIRSQVLPLFNFDYRKYFEFLPSLLKRDTSALGKIHFSIKYDEYLSLNNTNRTIARGVMYSYLIQYAFNTYFNKFISKPEESCNRFRMLLTVMFNLAYPDGLPEEIKDRNRKRPKHFTFQELIEKATIFQEEDILNMTVDFFPHEESSYAHWVMIYESNLYTLANTDFNYRKLKNEKLQNLNEDEKSFINLIENSYIHFNASAFAYLRYIISHYEYYLYLVGLENKTINTNKLPLALQTDVLYKIPCFLFEHMITLVFKFVERKKKKIEEYYEQIFFDEFPNERDYSKSYYSFGESKSKKSFYITKLITIHINYLDNFRYLAWNNEDFISALDQYRNKEYFDSEKKVNVHLKSDSQIQDFLINVIEKYINLYFDVKYRDPHNDSALIQMQEKIKQIRNQKNQQTGDYTFNRDNIKSNDKWIWIRTDKYNND